MAKLKKTQTFGELLYEVRMRGRTAYDDPRPMAEIAKLVQISRTHLYNLASGIRRARPASVARIARGLNVSRQRVTDALGATQEAYEDG